MVAVDTKPHPPYGAILDIGVSSMRLQVAQKNGKRCSAASSYLKVAAGRRNLYIETGAQTTKVMNFLPCYTLALMV